MVEDFVLSALQKGAHAGLLLEVETQEGRFVHEPVDWPSVPFELPLDACHPLRASTREAVLLGQQERALTELFELVPLRLCVETVFEAAALAEIVVIVKVHFLLACLLNATY